MIRARGVGRGAAAAAAGMAWEWLSLMPWSLQIYNLKAGGVPRVYKPISPGRG